MLVHSVFFWLKPELGDEERAAFREGLESLRGIETVTDLYIGSPADTHRPVIERTYTFGLTVLLAGMPEHDAYQVHPLHQAFLARFGDCWERVLIYDAD